MDNKDLSEKLDALATAVANGFDELHKEMRLGQRETRSDIAGIRHQIVGINNRLDQMLDRELVQEKQLSDHEDRIAKLEA